MDRCCRRLNQARTTDSTTASLDLSSPAGFRAGDDNGSPSERRHGLALRIGLEDIQAARENVSLPLPGERFVDVLEKIHRSLGEIGDSTVKYMVPTMGTSIRNDRAIASGSYSVTRPKTNVEY